MDAPTIRPTIRVIEFYTKYRKNRDGQTVPVDWVLWAPVGGAAYSQTPERIKDIIPPEEYDEGSEQIGQKIARMRDKWRQIEPAYRAWKNGQEAPETGTPLAAWPGLTREQIKVLHLTGMKTLEELAYAEDHVLARVNLPGKHDLKKQAALFLESQDKAQATAALVEAQDKIAALEAKMAELLASEDKPKRGRPRKEEASEEAAA